MFALVYLEGDYQYFQIQDVIQSSLFAFESLLISVGKFREFGVFTFDFRFRSTPIHKNSSRQPQSRDEYEATRYAPRAPTPQLAP
jgi:hypothetical protein